MNFEQFQATRREMRHSEIGLNDDTCDPEVACLVYLDVLFIEKTATWEVPTTDGAYFLLIANEQTISDDLEKLERELYEYAMDAGYGEPADRLTAAVVDDALNAALAVVQKHLGVTDGGFASVWFSDDAKRDAFANVLREYVNQEPEAANA